MSQPLNLCLLTISDSRTPDDDASGDYLAQAFAADGHILLHRAICVDDKYRIRAIVSAWPCSHV